MRGDSVEIFPAPLPRGSAVEFFGDEIDRILGIDTLTGEVIGERHHVAIFPASHRHFRGRNGPLLALRLN